MKKQFPLADLITITTGRFVTDHASLYLILNHLTGDNLYTHQLPRAMDECKPWLIRWHPQLSAIDTEILVKLLAASDEAKDACEEWVRGEQLRLQLPHRFDLEPIPRDDHDVRDPLEELQEMVNDDKILVVEADQQQ